MNRIRGSFTASTQSLRRRGHMIARVLSGTIISGEELRDLLVAGDDLVLLDARKDRTAFDIGHLRGARFADANEHLSTPAPDASLGGRHPLPRIEQWTRTVGDWGIVPSTNVVVYDDQSGANAAARAWWMLRSIGHKSVAVLDGGLAAAVEAGAPLTTQTAAFERQPPYPARRWLRPTVDIETVDKLRTDPGWLVVDVRAASRFAGDEEPIDPVAGHIPGASNLPFEMNLANGRFRPASELRAMYERLLGPVRPDRLVVHCGSGVTGCHTLLALEIAGLFGASLFAGGWSEWCRSGRPRVPERSPGV